MLVQLAFSVQGTGTPLHSLTSAINRNYTKLPNYFKDQSSLKNSILYKFVLSKTMSVINVTVMTILVSGHYRNVDVRLDLLLFSFMNGETKVWLKLSHILDIWPQTPAFDSAHKNYSGLVLGELLRWKNTINFVAGAMSKSVFPCLHSVRGWTHAHKSRTKISEHRTQTEVFVFICHYRSASEMEVKYTDWSKRASIFSLCKRTGINKIVFVFKFKYCSCFPAEPTTKVFVKWFVPCSYPS